MSVAVQSPDAYQFKLVAFEGGHSGESLFQPLDNTTQPVAPSTTEVVADLDQYAQQQVDQVATSVFANGLNRRPKLESLTRDWAMKLHNYNDENIEDFVKIIMREFFQGLPEILNDLTEEIKSIRYDPGYDKTKRNYLDGKLIPIIHDVLEIRTRMLYILKIKCVDECEFLREFDRLFVPFAQVTMDRLMWDPCTRSRESQIANSVNVDARLNALLAYEYLKSSQFALINEFKSCFNHPTKKERLFCDFITGVCRRTLVMRTRKKLLEQMPQVMTYLNSSLKEINRGFIDQVIKIDNMYKLTLQGDTSVKPGRVSSTQINDEAKVRFVTALDTYLEPLLNGMMYIWLKNGPHGGLICSDQLEHFFNISEGTVVGKSKKQFLDFFNGVFQRNQ